MTDLEAAVPPYEPADDALALTGRLALSAIPVVGSFAAETLAHALDTRQAHRQHRFNLTIAAELSAVVERLNGSLTLEDLVGSDEFIAAVTGAQRLAAETASESKRRRLAAAAVQNGSWSGLTSIERERFTRLIGDFSDLHVWLLSYFTDPKAWLDAHGLSSAYVNIYMGGIDGPLAAALGASDSTWRGPVAQAVNELEQAGLAHIPLGTMMSGDGTIQPRTNEVGRRFLTFLNEPKSVESEPPVI